MDATDSLINHTKFAFPRDHMPVPPFMFDVPNDWTAGDAPGCLVALREPAQPGTFRANLTVSVDHVRRAVDLEDAAARTLADLEQEQIGGEVRLETEKVVTVADSPASLRVQTFRPQGLAHRVLQLQFLFFAPDVGGDARRLLTLIGTCLEDDSDLYMDHFVAAGRTFSFAAP